MQNEKARPPAGLPFAFCLFNWLRRALRPRGEPLLVAVLLLALAARAVTVTLGWDYPTNSPATFRVFIGHASGDYYTNFASQIRSFAYEMPEPGRRYWFAVRAETTNSVSALSNEATCELLPTPNLASVPHVRLTVAAQSSGDLLTWTNQTFPPLWLPATNPAQFWRNPSLQISRENAAWPGLTTATN